MQRDEVMAVLGDPMAGELPARRSAQLAYIAQTAGGASCRWSLSPDSRRLPRNLAQANLTSEASARSQVCTLYDQMARIVLTPDWANVLDVTSEHLLRSGERRHRAESGRLS